MNHTEVPKGAIIVILEGTKVFTSTGTFTAKQPYTVEAKTHSGKDSEYVFWGNCRAKKINVMLGQKVW